MAKKYFKDWSYECDPDKEEITVYVQDTRRGWITLAIVPNCPTFGMVWEEIDNEYNDTLTELIDNAGYEFAWRK